MQSSSLATPAPKRRVLIIDDHNFFAACLRVMLDNESDLVVCDVATNSSDARERIERLKPDLLVIDLTLGAESGLEVGRRLRAMHIETPILFVSTMSKPTRAQIAEVAHSAFIPKSKKPAQFLEALRAVLAGGAELVELGRTPGTSGFALAGAVGAA